MPASTSNHHPYRPVRQRLYPRRCLIFSPSSRIPSLWTAASFVAFLSLLCRTNASAQTAPPAADTLQSDAVYFSGLGDIKPQTKGTLALSGQVLEFTNNSVRGAIPVNRILSVSVGNEKSERGGTTGSIARHVIPYGGGLALAAASQNSVDILTVEYQDAHHAYHGAVFVMPSNRAETLHQKLTASIQPLEPVAPATCTTPQANTILVEPIFASGVELPAEYRALLYEDLITELKRQRPTGIFLRAGDDSVGPHCTALALRISVMDFKKGNRSVRAYTGPLGFFLSPTSVSFQMHLEDATGKSLFDGQLKDTKRGDSESLNVAHNLAKTVTKRLNKTLKQSAADTAV